VIAKISEADLDKGRRLYCLDSRYPASPVLAALAFQITAVAIGLEDQDARARSHVAAWYLTQYVHDPVRAGGGQQLGRPAFIEMISSAAGVEQDLRILGFEHVSRPTYARVGQRAFRQPAESEN
jgi:hypothetical protein